MTFFSFRNCIKVTYPEEIFPSVMSEWHLVCDRAWMGPMIMSMFMAGVMVGAIVLGSTADRIGRRKTLSLTFTTMILANLAGAYATNYVTYVFLRFLRRANEFLLTSIVDSTVLQYNHGGCYTRQILLTPRPIMMMSTRTTPGEQHNIPLLAAHNYY